MASSGDMTEQQLKNFIKGIVTSNPIVTTIQSIQKDFREMIGTAIPFQKFGFNSVEHFLKSIPDTCVVRGTGPFAQVTLIPSEKSAHINEMVVKQKVNSKGRKPPRRKGGPPVTRRNSNWQPTYYSFSPNSSGGSSSSFGYPSSGGHSKTTNNTLLPTANKNTRIQSVNTGIRNMNIQGTNTGVQNNCDQNANGPIVRQGNIKTNLKGENTEERRSYIVEKNNLDCRKLGIAISSISSPKKPETENLSNSKNIRDNAPISVRDTLDTFNITKSDSTQDYPNQASESCEDARFNKSKEKLNSLLYNFNSVKEEEEDTSNVPKRVQLHLQTLISQFMNGIWCSDLPAHYQKLFRKDLMYMEYGYTSLIEMCIALKNIFHYVRPGRDDFKLYDRSKPLPENVEKFYTMASYDVGEKVINTEALPDLEWADFKGHIPENILKLGNEIPREFLPVGTKVDNILNVVVTEIYDPSKFWFYLGTSDRNNTPLDQLMDRMQTFYGKAENTKEYAIPPGAVREGLYCVQVIYSEYHRARIVRVLADTPDYVRVMFIDYGTVCKVPVKGMCFLHAEFAELNAQAIRGRLTNIVPNLKAHPWPRTTSDRFRQLVNRRDTKIKVSYVDWNEEYVCVFLADVTDKDNVLYINETLVNENHAVWDGETQVVPFVLSNFKCKVQNIHLFPTFVELEYGLAPNASEMYALEDMLVPLQFCIPQYFEPDEQIFSSRDDEEIEQIENSFIETVKNHRKFASLNKVDMSILLNPPAIDFDVFGDLKDEMIAFCERENLVPGTQSQNTDQNSEEELFCDIEEDAAEEAAGISLEHFKAIERDLEEFEPIQVTRQNKELTESIIHELERCSSLDFEHSSDTESVGLLAEASQNSIVSPELENLALQKEPLSPEVVDQLSTIYEHSELELDTSNAPKSPTINVFGFAVNRRQLRPDVNIFDNPEEFEENSDTSEDSESGQIASPESFLKTIEKMSRKDLEEEIENIEESNCTTENPPAVCPDSENPFQFDVNAELKEAFKTFLNAQKKSTGNVASGSSSQPSTSFFNHSHCEEQGSLENASNCEESFLKYNSQNTSDEEENSDAKRTKADDLERAESLEVAESYLNLPFKDNLEDTRKSFVSTLSLNNPFRSYFETDDKTDDLSTDLTECPLLGVSVSTDSSATNLHETGIKLKDAEAQTISSSDSEGSDYKVFVPRNQGPVSSTSNQESLGSQDQRSTGSSELYRPRRVETSPRMSNHSRGSSVSSQDTSEYWVQSSMEARGINRPPWAETPPRMRNQSQGSSVSNHERSGPWVQNYMGTAGNIPPPRISTPPRMFPPPGFMPPGYPPYPQWSNGTGYPLAQYPQWSTGGNHPIPGPSYPHPRDTLRPPPGFSYQGPPQNYNPYMGPRMIPTAPVYLQGGPVCYTPPRQLQTPALMPENDFYDRYNESLLRRSNELS